MVARYGVVLKVASKSRALTLAKTVRKEGYGAMIVNNTGRDAKVYPYLVKRTDSPLSKRPVATRPVARPSIRGVAVPRGRAPLPSRPTVAKGHSKPKPIKRFR